MLDANELPNGNVDDLADSLGNLTDEDDAAADALVVLGSLDPTEIVDGRARWTQSQSRLILAAAEELEKYK
jgi:hypothetical protein